jgi:hypothetical protein
MGLEKMERGKEIMLVAFASVERMHPNGRG